jgi:azurin
MKHLIVIRSIIFALFALIFTSTVMAQDCTIEVTVGDNLNFIPADMSVSKSECTTLTISLSHNGSLPRNGMGHNWVLAGTANAQATAQAGWQAGLDNQYIRPGDDRVIATTDIIGGGESTTMTFSLESLEVGGDYTYFCSFVGHFGVMKGSFTVNE